MTADEASANATAGGDGAPAEDAQVLLSVGGLQNMAWASDTSKFGYKMLVKMGWSAGKGVGKNLQGQNTHVKVQRRSEALGVGCSLKQAEVQGWSSTAQGFADVLKTLNKSYGDAKSSSNSDDDSSSEADTDAKKSKKRRRKEEKRGKKSSKKSKHEKKAKREPSSKKASGVQLSRRILYNKRLKNKNAKMYDAADMSAILGVAAASSS